MANKSANVSVRVQPEVKQQAEAVLERLGLPVSVLIDTLYRQIIYTGGVPYPLTVPKLPTLDTMSKEEFDAMLEEGYNQAMNGEGIELDAAFDMLQKEIRHDVQS